MSDLHHKTHPLISPHTLTHTLTHTYINAGHVRTYYKDLQAVVTSLPKFGTLSTSISPPQGLTPKTPGYGDFQEDFLITGDTEARLNTAKGAERKVGLCYGVVGTDDPYGTVRSSCDNNFNFNMPPSLSDHILGNTPDVVYLRNERTVLYTPYLHYLGTDHFTYEMYDGLNVQIHSGVGGGEGIEGNMPLVTTQNEVTVNTVNCRHSGYLKQFNVKQTPHPLCACDSTEVSLIGDTYACGVARNIVCGVTSQTTTTSTVQAFYNLCVVCPDWNLDPRSGTGSSSSNSFPKGECLSQIGRAVSMLKLAGMCGTLPRSDCSDEVVTMQSGERTSYLSLKSPSALGSISDFGTGLGGVGWYAELV